MDSETTATKYSCAPSDIDFDLDDNGSLSTECTESTVSKQHSLDTLNENESIARRNRESITDSDGDIELDQANDIEIEFELPQMKCQATDADTQTSTPMDEILKYPSLIESHSLSAVDKITEWMNSKEFERTDSLAVDNGDTTSITPITVYTNIASLSTNHTTISTATDDDKTITDQMDQVPELDDMVIESKSRRGTFDNPIIHNLSLGGSPIFDNKSIETMAEVVTKSGEESFVEVSTHNSLQIALKNRFPIHYLDTKTLGGAANDKLDLVVLKNPLAPKIRVNAAQTPPSPSSPPLPLPPRTPSPGPEQQLPPIPPKRKTSQELVTNSSITHSSLELSPTSSVSSRQPSQIIIMRTPEQSPTKLQTTPTSSPKKRQSFFSRLFSRRKSKIEIMTNDKSVRNQPTKVTTPFGSKEPSIGNFSIADPNRSSLRSIKSATLQFNSNYLDSSNNGAKQNERKRNIKPVGRSVSSISGKRPAHLNADVIHIPLKGDNAKSLPSHEGKAFTFGQYLDRKTVSALQLAEIPICDGKMELVAIADRQSIQNLCEGEFGVTLDPEVDLQEAEHFALYTSIPPERQFTANNSDIDIKVCASMEDVQVVTADEIAKRLNEANRTQIF